MKKTIALGLSIIFVFTFLTGCLPTGATPPDMENIKLVQLEPPVDGQEMAVMTTNVGVIKFVLYEDYAPKTVAHFKKLVEEGFYNNNVVHSTEKDRAIVMMGATDEKGEEGKIVTEDGEGIKTEVSYDLWHYTGAVSAFGVETGFMKKEILSDSRFFMVGNREPQQEVIDKMQEVNYPQIVIDGYKKVGGVPEVTGAYTVFGNIIEGLDLINNIAATEVDENKKPIEDFIIEKIEITNYKAE